MTALEEARAAERGLTITIDFAVRMGGCPTREMYAARDALRALIAEHERLTAPPTDDTITVVASFRSEPFTGSNGVSVVYVTPYATMPPSLMVDGLILPPSSVTALREFFRRRRPITDAQVEAAAHALFDASQELDQDNDWSDPLPDEWREAWRDAARAVLEAAREADR